VSVIDTSTDTVVATIPVGTKPGSIDISPDGKRAYVANFDTNNISVINTETDSVIATVNVGTHPGTIALRGGGATAFVLNEDSNNVSVVDTVDLANFVEVASGATFKSTTDLPLLEFNPSTLDLGGDLVSIRGDGSKMELAGQLAKAEDTKFNVRRILIVRDGGVLTNSTAEPLMQFTGTAPDKSKVDTLFEFAVIDQLDTTDKPPKVELAGPFLEATNTSFSAGENSLNKSNFMRVADGGLLKSTGTEPLITFNGSTLNPSFRFLAIETPDSTGKEPKVEVAGPLLKALNSSFSTEGDLIALRDKGILKGTGSTPLVQSENSTFNIGSEVQGFGDFFSLDDNTTVSAQGPSIVELAGPLIQDSGSTFDIFERFLDVRDGSTFTSTSADPLLQFSNSTVDTGRNFLLLLSSNNQPPSLTLSGALLTATNTDFTTGDPALNRNSFLTVTDSSTLTSTGTDPLVTFNASTLDTAGNFLTLSDSKTTASTVSLAGPLLKATGSTFKTFSTFQVPPGSNCCSFLFSAEKSKLESTGLAPLMQFTNSTFDIGSSLVTLTNVNDFNPGTPAPSTITLAGPLVSDSNSTFNITSRFLSVSDGSSLTSTTASPLITLSGSTVNTKNDFLLLIDSASKITLSGSFLSAGSTLNIGTDPTLFGDLLDVRAPAQLVMNSSNPVVLFTGGTHTVGTDDATANDTVNRLFRLSGVNTDGTTGLGTDQPIKGTNLPFAGANNPIGVLLKATEGSTIEVKKGAADTAGGNAVRFDTMLYEATAGILELIGSATKETTLKTADTAMDIFKSKVVMNAPVVFLDKSFIHVQNGPFIHIRGGSDVDIKADLLKLFNGSKIEVINGPLIKAEGANSILKVAGALAEVGGSGTNKIIVNNAIAETATKSGIKVHEATGGTVSIGPNPIKGSTVASTITQNGVVIQAINNGKVNITAP
jgi:YVTN family beta-propeller protein